MRTCRRGGSEAWRCLKGRPSKQRDSQNTGQQEVPRRPEASQGGCEGEAERASKRRAAREAAKVKQSEQASGEQRGRLQRWSRASEWRAARDKVGGASGDLLRRLAGYLQSSHQLG